MSPRERIMFLVVLGIAACAIAMAALVTALAWSAIIERSMS